MPDQRTVTNSYTNGLLTGVTGFANAHTYQANGLLDTVTRGNAVKER